ncbi:LOW QUALITY PROTEIN: arf-GAP with Rho-GAP domain, ANK repeat and PH domain-containing protein 1, partial [Vipera latastei]
MADGPSLALAEWLQKLRLDQYIETFEQNQLRCLQDCQHLTDESLNRLGVLLPGHRKRILSGLSKFFAESPSSSGRPQLPPRRPVPKKRHIFRTAAPLPGPEARRDLAGPRGKEPPPERGSEAPVGLPLIPPPIPPRTSFQPPVKFSASFPEFPAEVFSDPACPSPQPACERLSPRFLEEGGLPLLPPLPVKRHQLESRPSLPAAPPVPLRPPTLPPRAASQRAMPRSTPNHHSNQLCQPTFFSARIQPSSWQEASGARKCPPPCESQGPAHAPSSPSPGFAPPPSPRCWGFVLLACRAPTSQRRGGARWSHEGGAHFPASLAKVSAGLANTLPSSPAREKPPESEDLQIVPTTLFPRVKLTVHNSGPEIPPKPPLLLHPEFEDSDYEDPPFEEERETFMEEMTDKKATPQTRRSARFNSLFSEDELVEDYFKEEPVTKGTMAQWLKTLSVSCGKLAARVQDPSASWWGELLSLLQLLPHLADLQGNRVRRDLQPLDEGLSPSSSATGALPFGMLSGIHGDGGMCSAGPSLPLSPVIKAGWLDKNPPQGSYIYQKRWVKLESDYLRYFDSEKDVYSKRFILVASISQVSSIGDQKFEVITNNRTFAFRAESDAERNEWIQAVQKMVDEKKSRCLHRPSFAAAGSSLDSVEKSGALELRGFKSKLYVAVAGEKVFLYKNAEEFRLGIGITYIEMNVGNVKDVDRRCFDLTTPYRIFSFMAESDQEKELWVEAMLQSVAEALSNFEVAERIWALKDNCLCADCGAPKPDWASINLCVVICKQCAGEHRGLGPGVTKVRSLKMDKKVWTEELIELFLQIGNAVANQFWAANVPPSEMITPESPSQQRRHFLVAKYQEGKYRRFHPLFGNQDELNQALCTAVTTSDLAESLSLLFCGAVVDCYTGDPDYPTPFALAEQAGQRLQMEFLLQNKTSWVSSCRGLHWPLFGSALSFQRLASWTLAPTPTSATRLSQLSVAHNGFLYKAPLHGQAGPRAEPREEFSRRWCQLQDGLFNYYESNTNTVPNGEVKMQEIVCLAIPPPD